MATSDKFISRHFLDGELAKYETWVNVNKSIKVLFASNRQFQQCKQEGVGQTTILKFLGGNWKQWMIQSALKTDSLAKEGKLDPKAVVVFDKIDHADKFKTAVIELEVPVKEQLKIAKKVRENIDEKRTSSQGRTRDGKTKTSIADDVADLVIPIPNLKAPKKRKRKALPNIVEFVFKCESDTDNLNRRLEALMPEIEEISKTRLLGRLIPGLKQLGKTISQLTTECEKARTQNGKNKKAKAMAIA